MASEGRLVALVVSSPAGAVVHERFHVRLTELERADLRAALAANAAGLVAGCDRPRPGGAPPPPPPDGAQAVGRYRAAVLVSHVEGGLILHGAGTGDCDELTVSRALRALGAALRTALAGGKRAPTPAAAFESYGKLVVAVDDVCCEGVVDATAAGSAARAARLRGGCD